MCSQSKFYVDVLTLKKLSYDHKKMTEVVLNQLALVECALKCDRRTSITVVANRVAGLFEALCLRATASTKGYPKLTWRRTQESSHSGTAQSCPCNNAANGADHALLGCLVRLSVGCFCRHPDILHTGACEATAAEVNSHCPGEVCLFRDHWREQYKHIPYPHAHLIHVFISCALFHFPSSRSNQVSSFFLFPVHQLGTSCCKRHLSGWVGRFHPGVCQKEPRVIHIPICKRRSLQQT